MVHLLGISWPMSWHGGLGACTVTTPPRSKLTVTPSASLLGENIGPVIAHAGVEEIANTSISIEDHCTRSCSEMHDDKCNEFLGICKSLEQKAMDAESQRSVICHKKHQECRDIKHNNVAEMPDSSKGPLDERWSAVALEHVDSCEQEHQSSIHPAIKFLSPFVDSLPRQHISAPSKMKSRSKQRNVAKQIDEHFELFFKRQFVQFGFLSQRNPFEAKLKMFCDQKCPDLDSILLTEQVNANFFDSL